MSYTSLNRINLIPIATRPKPGNRLNHINVMCDLLFTTPKLETQFGASIFGGLARFKMVIRMIDALLAGLESTGNRLVARLFF